MVKTAEMKRVEIGGYFGLEIPKGSETFHHTPFAFKSGRSALHFILDHIKPSLVYIPYYTCNALVDSFEAANANFKFYKINDQLEPEELPDLGENEYFLYINYYDVKRSYSERLSERYGDKLIIDCSQAFFMKGNGVSWYFNSCRKFFGVPDGSYVYVPASSNAQPVQNRNEGYKVDHLLQRFNGHTRDGYQAFLENEMLLGTDISGMSQLSEYLLSNVDYAAAANKRKKNYKFLHEVYRGINHLNLDPEAEAPMYYPLLLSYSSNRELLYSRDVFIPVFWKDVIKRNLPGFEREHRITENLYPLPIDHRYTEEEMKVMVEALNVIM